MWETSTLSSRLISWILNIDIIIDNGTFDFNYTLDGAFYNNPNDKDDPIRGINLKKSGLLKSGTYNNNVTKIIKELKKGIKANGSS